MHMRALHARLPRHRRGATLIEALISLLVLAFGMLAFAGLQTRLRAAADVARQRSEAVRLAQEDIENFRAFGSLTPDASVPNNLAFSSIANDSASTPAPASNATYTLTRSVEPSATAGMKDLLVTVRWTDRDGDAQQVTLRSMIAAADPRLAAAMSIARNGTPVRDALGRSVRIPLLARSLGDGRSVLRPVASGNVAYIVDDRTGIATSRCDAVPTSVTTPALTAAGLSGYGCHAVRAQLLGGFVRFSTAAAPNADAANDPPPGPLHMRLDLDDTAITGASQGALALLQPAAWPVLTSSPPAAVDTGGYAAPECSSEPGKTIAYRVASSNARAVAVVPAQTPLTAAQIAPLVGIAAGDLADLSDRGERFVSYVCIVHPIDLDNDTATPLAWTGRLSIVAVGWTIGLGAADHKVCRYSSDYNLNGYQFLSNRGTVTRIDNAEHPYAYLNVQEGLTNQNFLVVNGGADCPADAPVEVDGQGGENPTSANTVLHQP